MTKQNRWPAACTIISRNYLSYARVLAESYQAHHPGGRFYLLVIDGLPEEAMGSGIQLVAPEELQLPYFRELSFKYDVTELCTAVKPTLLKLLLSRYDEREVIYFDPDILVMRQLDELFDCMRESVIVLIPHLLHPIPQDGLKPSERDILLAGAYNLGFLAVQKSPVTHDFLTWWETRLRDGCLMDHENGFMTDQRWIDLVPSLFPSAILRDDTYDVAYWNIHSRKLDREGNGFRVNSRPLAFFHFSGFNPAQPSVFSKHQTRTELKAGTGLSELLDLYVELQMRHGFERNHRSHYRFGSFSNSVAIHGLARRIYGELDERKRIGFGDPFQTGAQSFFDWLTRRYPTSGLSPFLRRIHATRLDVATAYPHPDGADSAAFLAWAATSGARELGYDPVAMRIVADLQATAHQPARGHSPGVRCSIIVPVHNKASLTLKCLDTIFSTIPADPSTEVIIADDASTDDTRTLLSSYANRIRVLVNQQNRGFGETCNGAAQTAAGEYLVFLNNDTVPQPNWLSALVLYADQHAEAAIVGSRLLFPNDTVQHAGFAICGDGEPRHVYTGFPAEHPAVMRSRKMQAVTGACMLVRRADFDRAGGFDPVFRNGYEDVDLCLRLGEMGRESHYCHESLLYHLESISRKVNHSAEERENCDHYLRRWARRTLPDDLQFYVQDGLLKVEYFPLFPARFSISPLLATTGDRQSESTVDRLLQSRSRQVLGLLKDNIRLSVRLEESELRSEVPGRSNRASAAPAAPRLIHKGQNRRLSKTPSGRVVSIILPVKNGAAKLRELIPAILGQKTQDLIEIVAVDSGSTDESVELLKAVDANIVAIDPDSFNHGLTRNLATNYAGGSILVFVNQSTLPANEHWLANLTAPFSRDRLLTGVCGRVLPRPDADLLTARDIQRNINASDRRVITSIDDPVAYRSLTREKLRAFVNFHTLSAAIRADVFQRIPFREARFAEDLIWGKDALEAGYRIQYEPRSVAYHSHNYSLLDIFRRNFDDGAACREIVGRELPESEVISTVLHLVRDDWRYFDSECHFSSEELERWRLASASRRTAQVIGQWLGVNYDGSHDGLTHLLSLTEQIRSGAKTEMTEFWSSVHAGNVS